MRLTHAILNRVIDSRASGSLLALLERAESRRPNLLRVLTYHRVTDRSIFEQHMRYLASHYNVASLSALLDAVAGRRALPPRSVMITFDDGYREVGDVAWPVLRRLGLGAVLFVPTAYPDPPGQTFWWDRLEQALNDTPRREEIETPIGRLPLARPADRVRACSRLKRYLETLHHDDAPRGAEAIIRQLDAPPGAVPAVLGWDDLRRLAGEGLAIGAHSRTHPVMNRLPVEAAREEILGAQHDLRRELGEVPPVFCYPGGWYGPAVLGVLREAGITVAFTTRRGTNDLSTDDPLRLRRINVSRAAGLPVLRARLAHSSVHLNRWRRFFDPQPACNGHRSGVASTLGETARRRLLYKPLDAVVTASLRPRRGFAASLRSMLTPRSSNYDRMGSLINLLDAMVPGTARRATELVCRRMDPPFDAERIELLAYGSGTTVFLAEGSSGSRVLKIYRKSLGASARRLPGLVEEFRQRYDVIRSWYDGLPGLVWPGEFIVLRGPILGRPAVACVQDYIDDETTDFFRGFSNGELAAVLGGSRVLRRQFLLFAERTLDIYRSQRCCPDFLGENNLSIVGSGGDRRLCLIDYGMFDLAATDGRTPETLDRIEGGLERIRTLAQHLATPDPAEILGE